MKSNLKVKFLQHLNTKKNNGGFTLIELLVVIIIIGILTAIALPSFLNQSNKAKLTEAKNTVRSVSESQKAFFVEEASFITEGNIAQLIEDKIVTQALSDVPAEEAWLEALGIAVDGTETANYFYRQEEPDSGTLSVNAIPRTKTMDNADGDNTSAAHKAYIGGLTVVRNSVDQIYCEALESPVDQGPTGQDALDLSAGTEASCPDDNYRPSRPDDN